MLQVALFTVVLSSSAWVFVDARALGARRGVLGGGFLDSGPGGWLLGCLLLWLIAFPAYLIARPRLVAAKRAREAIRAGWVPLWATAETSRPAARSRGRLLVLLAVAVALAATAVTVWQRFESNRNRAVDRFATRPDPGAWPSAQTHRPLRLAHQKSATDLSVRYRINYAHVPERRFARADFAIDVVVTTGQRSVRWLVAHERGTRRFARYRLPVADGRPTELQGLADGGRQALLAATVGAGARHRLCLLTLANGEQRWFDSDPDTYGAGLLAAPSPDGRQIATVTVVYDPADPRGETEDLSRVAVGVIDVASGTYRRLWLSPETAGWGEGSGIAWSPDRKLLAATYLYADSNIGDEEMTTIVLTTTGQTARRLPTGSTMVPTGNAAWLAAHQLTIDPNDDAGASVVDLVTGARRAVDAGRVVARTGDWFVTVGDVPRDGPVPLLTRRITGGTARPWISLAGRLQVTCVAFADR